MKYAPLVLYCQIETSSTVHEQAAAVLIWKNAKKHSSICRCFYSHIWTDKNLQDLSYPFTIHLRNKLVSTDKKHEFLRAFWRLESFLTMKETRTIKGNYMPEKTWRDLFHIYMDRWHLFREPVTLHQLKERMELFHSISIVAIDVLRDV